MEMLKFAGGVNIGELTSTSAGSVHERYTVPLREAASKRSLIIEEQDVTIVKKDVIDGFVHKIMGSTEVPTLRQLPTPKLIHEIKKLQSSTKAAAVVDQLASGAYATVDSKDVEAQKVNAVERAREQNEAARTKALLSAIREEGAATQGAIASYVEKVHSDTAAIQATVAAIFNRKVGADDRYKKAMLTSQYTQESIARDQLEVAKLSSRMVHEIGLKLIHNTSLPDIVKSTHEERNAILDEENIWRLKNAFWQGNFESTLRNMNAALVNKTMAGLGRVGTKINSMGVDDQGNARTRTGAIAEWATNKWEGYRAGAEIRDSKFSETREKQGWFAAQKERMGDIAGSGWEKAKGTASSTGKSIKDKFNANKKYYKDNTFKEMYGQAKDATKFQLLDKDGLVRRWGVNPIKDAGSAVISAITDTMAGKSDYELAVDRTTGITVTIPDHLVKINAVLEDIYDSLSCVCKDKNSGKKKKLKKTGSDLDKLEKDNKDSKKKKKSKNTTENLFESVIPGTAPQQSAPSILDIIDSMKKERIKAANTAPTELEAFISRFDGTAPQQSAPSILDIIDSMKKEKIKAANTAPTELEAFISRFDGTAPVQKPSIPAEATAISRVLDNVNAARASIGNLPAATQESPIQYTPMSSIQESTPHKQYGYPDKSLYAPMAYQLSEDEASQLHMNDMRKAKDAIATTSKDVVDTLAAKVNALPKTSADINGSNVIAGVEKITGHLLMFPEYRKMLMKLGKRSSTKLVPKEQAVLVDRATEQVALLAMISKKLDMDSNLNGLFGNKGGAFGSLGAGLAGAVGGLAARGGASVLMRLLPLALSPPGLLAMTVLAAYLGRDKIAEAFSDVGTEISTAFSTGKNMANDTLHRLFGAESDNMKQLREKVERGEASPEEVKALTDAETKFKTQMDIGLTTAKGPIANAIALGAKAWGGVFTNEEFDDKADTPNEENPYADNGSKETRAGDKRTLESGYTGTLKNATGEAYFLPDIDPYLVCSPGKDKKYMDRFNKLNRSFRGTFLGMAFEYNKLTNKKIIVNETFRTRDEQARHHARDPKMAAPPGSSMHEIGFAIDASAKQNTALKECEDMGLMRKYGLWRPLKGELWHIEAIGIAPHIRAIKSGNTNDAQIHAWILSHRGHGGGGAALTGGKSRSGYDQVIKGGRNVSTAGIADMSSSKEGSSQDTKETKLATTESTVSNSPDPIASTPPAAKIADVGKLGPVGTPVAPDMTDSKDEGKATLGSTANASPTSNPEVYVVKKMMEHKWSKDAAIGIAANLKQESEFNHKAVGDNGSAYGLGQWRKERRYRDFEAFAGKRMEDSSFDEQLAYINHELRNGEKNKDGSVTARGKTALTAGKELATATSAEAAAESFMRNFERPQDEAKEVGWRNAHVKNIREKVNGLASAAPANNAATGPKDKPDSKSYYLYGSELADIGKQKDIGTSAASTAQSKSSTPDTVSKSTQEQSTGYMKTSFSPAPVTSPPAMFNTPELNSILLKSHAVQTDMLTELRKLNSVFTNQQGVQSSSPPTASPAVNTNKPSIKDRIRSNTINSTDQIGATI